MGYGKILSWKNLAICEDKKIKMWKKHVAKRIIRF